MKREERYTVRENNRLCEGIYELKLSGAADSFTAPGQFMDIELEGLFLRRPISIADIGDAGPVIVFKVVGDGTRYLSEMQPGDSFKALPGLGNGFSIVKEDRPSVIGGGVGIPPLYHLTKTLISAGQKPVVTLGFADAGGAFYTDKFRELGAELRIATMDGSMGIKGLVTDAMPKDSAYFYACGPLPMLRAVCEASDGEGQVSLEARMGCGFGACMGCSIMTKDGAKRVCKDGPIFRKSTLDWSLL